MPDAGRKVPRAKRVSGSYRFVVSICRIGKRPIRKVQLPILERREDSEGLSATDLRLWLALMLHTLLLIVPFGLTGAVSPMLLSEQTVLLAGNDGLAVARRFAIGAFVVAFAFIAMLVFFGHAVSLPREPHLSSTLDLVLGAVLVVTASALHFGFRPHAERNEKERSPRAVGRHAAFGFGAFSMGTNFTTLAIMVPGAKIVAASKSNFAARSLFVLVLALMISAPVWLPLVLSKIAPGPAERGLTSLGNLIESHGRFLTIVLVGGLGAILVLHGLYRIFLE